MAILTVLRSYLIAVLIFTVEHPFMSLLTICISYLKKCLCRSSLSFELGFLFLLLSCMSCLYILEIKPLSVISFADIFFHSALFFLQKYMPMCNEKNKRCYQEGNVLMDSGSSAGRWQRKEWEAQDVQQVEPRLSPLPSLPLLGLPSLTDTGSTLDLRGLLG